MDMDMCHHFTHPPPSCDVYCGTFAIQISGSIITKEDLRKYRPEWKRPTSLRMRGPNGTGSLTLHSMPPPGGGPVLALILNILQGNVTLTFYHTG